ncbi:MAG: acyl-[acyl-carrier-protein]--UDP-N-acetylglucosamine O-acyltransferase [Omnitrophica bacterium GWA2_52_8]|nr:MAG: acyl-[acyl-carrier-protein]--UDP-N-acetylglucosamine O-acyltransferase [Omnitrophica bacterium GWA2_52_8]
MLPMSNIHPTALIGNKAVLGTGNIIGPHVIVENGAVLGNHNKIGAGAYICAGTILGNENEIHMHSVIGHAPQDLAYSGAESFTKIGDRNQIREFVTIHRGTMAESSTIIGNENYLMAYCHIAHNCTVGNKVIMVNQASLTGHITVEDQAFLSGMTGFHQFTRIGRLAMVSALSAANKDIPPFMTAGGRPAVVLGVNVVGMRRAGIDSKTRDEIKQAYKWLYRSGLNVSQALEIIKKELASPEIKHLISFIEGSKRGIIDGASEELQNSETLRPRKTYGTS